MAAVMAMAAAGASCPPDVPGHIRFRDKVTIRSRDLRLGAIADLSALPGYLRPRAAAIVLFRVERDHVQVSWTFMAARAKALMPLLRCWLGRGQGDVTITQVREAPVAPRSSRPPPEESVSRGSRLTMVASVGPVRVTRAVEALQQTRPGGRLFVRDGDGQILSVRYSGPNR